MPLDAINPGIGSTPLRVLGVTADASLKSCGWAVERVLEPDVTRLPSNNDFSSSKLKLLNFVVRELSLLDTNAGMLFVCLILVIWRGFCIEGVVPLPAEGSSKCCSSRCP